MKSIDRLDEPESDLMSLNMTVENSKQFSSFSILTFYRRHPGV